MSKAPPALPAMKANRTGTPPRAGRTGSGAAPVPAGVQRGAKRGAGGVSGPKAGPQDAQNILAGSPSSVGFTITDDVNYRDTTYAPQDEEREQLAETAPAKAESEAADGVPPMVVRLNMLWSTAAIISLVIYISSSTVTSDGVSHDARHEHAWMDEIEADNPVHIACNESYNTFVRVCEPLPLANADSRCSAPNDALECENGCHYEPPLPDSCDWTSGIYNDGTCTQPNACTGCPPGCDENATTCHGTARGNCVYDPFRICSRSACSGHGDCINGDDPSEAECICDEGWGGLRCATAVAEVSIAGRKYGSCPESDCGQKPCPSCQEVLDELLHTCVDGDVEWFHDMEDDVRLPTRAAAIGCVLKGQLGERHEGETVFEDVGLLPELLENFLYTAYLCYALALLCEDFFVSSLDIIVEKLALPADVAGATFMAAGSSAPELFVSAAGVFITHSPVGVGACAGSTMFNTMCIIGGSALIAGKPVPLQWRSIVRDCGIYLVSLVALLLMLLDGRIEGWESIVMLGLYVFYIVLCAVWGKLVKVFCAVKTKAETADTLLEDAARENYEIGRLARQTASSKFKGATNQLIALQRLQAHTDLAKSTTNLLKKEGTADIATPVAQDPAARRTARQKTMTMDAKALQSIAEAATDPEHGADAHGEGGHHEHPGLCDIPSDAGARLAWAVSFPLMFIFTFTVPNCAKYPRVYPLTFIACIVWLGVLVEAMVEHASEFGALLGFSPGILGLTLLAAGTSFPDLVASLIVAKQGSIDMAVSNAFGSNNFDILLCLGLPWLLSIYFVTDRAEVIDTSGIVVALFSLIITTLIWFFYMMGTKWVLTPGVGMTMLTTYATWLLCQLILDMFSPEAHE